MSKSLHSAQYKKLLELLRATREERGCTQVELALALGEDQSYVSKCESGVRRLDVIELRSWVNGLGVPFNAFIKALDLELEHARVVDRRLTLSKRKLSS